MSKAGIQIKVPMEELRKRKLFLAAPMYGGQCMGMFTRSVTDLASECLKLGIQMQQFFLFNESLITRARNYCSDVFMRSDCTHMMFIDSDIGFDPKDVIALLALMGDDTEYDVMCGPYPKKTISWEKVLKAVNKGVADENPNELEKYVGDFVFNPKGGVRQIPLNEPVEVLEGGTGFMMIRKSILQKYMTEFPTQSYRPDHVRSKDFDGSREVHAFFDCVIDRGYTFDDVRRIMVGVSNGEIGIEEAKGKFSALLEAESKASKRYLSEDYMFCQNVARIGGKVWLCPWMRLQHVGTYVFGGSLIDLAQVGASATADVEEMKKVKRT